MPTKKDHQGYILLGIVGALLVAFVWWKASIGSAPKPGANNCIGEVRGNTVIVLDHSEESTDQTRAEIVARAMKHVHENVGPNIRVTVFAVSEDTKRSLLPIFSACRPPQTGNRLYENPKAIERTYREKFETPLREVLSVPPTDSKESPIAQAIVDITLSEYLRGESNTLLLFSDMLENTSKFSLYHCSSGSEAVQKFRASRMGAMERPKFKNTSVVLNVIPRFDLSAESLRCREHLWSWFFGDNEGPRASLVVDPLPGGPTK